MCSYQGPVSSRDVMPCHEKVTSSSISWRLLVAQEIHAWQRATPSSWIPSLSTKLCYLSKVHHKQKGSRSTSCLQYLNIIKMGVYGECGSALRWACLGTAVGAGLAHFYITQVSLGLSCWFDHYGESCKVRFFRFDFRYFRFSGNFDFSDSLIGPHSDSPIDGSWLLGDK